MLRGGVNDCKIKWEFLIGNSIDSSPILAKNGTIYLGSSNKNLYAINPDGSVKWFFKSGEIIECKPSIGKDGTIYFGSDKVYAINPDGTEKWRFDTKKAIVSDFTIFEDILYVTSLDGHLYAINPDGTEKWNFETGSWIIATPAIDENGTIYFGTRNGKFYALFN